MKNHAKTITSLTLIIVFLASCSLSIILFFIAGWIHTYKVFTQETPVAKVTISELKQDDLGSYFEVELKEIKGRSPLTSLFNPNEDGIDSYEDESVYKLYGDVVDIGGPTIKFKDFLTLFNFKTVYKIAFIRAEYSDIIDEDARTDDMTRRYDINGGYTTWRSVQEDFQNNNFRGSVFKLLIDDLPQLNSRGVFVTNQPQELTLCITEEGFLFCNK